MQNGKQISEIIQRLQSIEQSWEEFILEEGRKGDSDTTDLIGRLVYILRQELKAGNEKEILEYLESEKVSEKAAEKLVANAQKTLRFYRGVSLLRELEKIDENVLQELILTIYEKYVVRFERGYLDHIVVGTYSTKEIVDIASRVDYLTDFYISRSYTRQGIIEDLQDETGLSEKNCRHWADLIEQNYSALKMNYIVEEISKIKKMLRQT